MVIIFFVVRLIHRKTEHDDIGFFVVLPPLLLCLRVILPRRVLYLHFELVVANHFSGFVDVQHAFSNLDFRLDLGRRGRGQIDPPILHVS